MTTIDQIIEVVSAFRDGQTVQWRLKGVTRDFDWLDCGQDEVWNFSCAEYRIKPSPPKPREWWINRYYETEAVMCNSLPAAENANRIYPAERREVIHVIEVLPTSGEPPVTQPKPTCTQ